MSSGRLSPDEFQAIAGLPLFDGLKTSDLEHLLAGQSSVRHQHDTILFMQGDPAESFFLLLEGRVRLFVIAANGEQGLVDTMRGCCSFAEAAVLSAGHYPVSAEAERGSLLVAIEARHFLRHLDQNPHLAFQMLQNLHRWERQILDEIVRMKLLTPAQRLAHYFLSLRASPQPSERLRLPISKSLLAERIGIEPESLSRALKRLGGIGVQCDGSNITVEDWSLVQQFVTPDAAEIVRSQDEAPSAGARLNTSHLTGRAAKAAGGAPQLSRSEVL